MRHFVGFAITMLVVGCHEDAKCPAGMMVDEALGYCVTPDAGTDGGMTDAGAMDAATRDSPVCVAETCNGADDDCDGTPDDGFACARGTTIPCTTTCGSTGTTTCSATCEAPPTCTPPTETCNYADDDCDGLTDEDLLDPGPGIDLAGPSSQVDVVAVPGGFVIANVRAAAVPPGFDLIRVSDEGTVTHTVVGVGDALRVALAERSGEAAVVWTTRDASHALIGERFAAADLTALSSPAPISAGASGLAWDLASSSSTYALTASDSMGGAIWKLAPSLTRVGVPVSIEAGATVTIAPAPGSPWVIAYAAVPAGASLFDVFSRTVDSTTLALGPEVRVTSATGGAISPVVSYAHDGSRLAVLYGLNRSPGVPEPEVALLDVSTLAVGSTVPMPRPSTRSFVGPTYGLTWSGGRWWIARIVTDTTPGFVPRLRVVEIAADGTALASGVMGRSPECDPPDAECAPADARDAAAIASGNGRVLVATSATAGAARAWLYRCR